jgi:hypothetical protein
VSFNNSAIFENTNFNKFVNFSKANFKYANFLGANFNSNVKFSNAKFELNDFEDVKFNDYANFSDASFNNDAQFRNTSFYKSVNFSNASYNSNAYFIKAKFYDSANFKNTNFNKSASFAQANFYKSVIFLDSKFNDSAVFSNTGFDSDVFFTHVNFNNSTSFLWARFNDSARFIGPNTPENIVSDGDNVHIFIKYYNKVGQYDKGDVVYFNHRLYNLEHRPWNDFSFITDLIAFITCGYGVKVFYPIYFGSGIIVLFSLIYAHPLKTKRYKNKLIGLSRIVHLEKSNNQIIPIKFTFDDPFIVNDIDDKKKASLSDIICYSIGAFTFISYKNWSPKEYVRICVVAEGVIGWLTLGIFMATLTRWMMRF